MRLPRATDTRLLVAGVAASLALVAYLAVAFARTHVALVATDVNRTAPWSPFASNLVPVPELTKGKFAVRVTPATRRPTYGAVAQTIVPDPARGYRYVIGLQLKGARPGPIAVELNEFRPGVAKYPLQTTVPATARWHRFTFTMRVRGTWLGLAMVVSRTDPRRRTWFALRDLTVEAFRH